MRLQRKNLRAGGGAVGKGQRCLVRALRGQLSAAEGEGGVGVGVGETLRKRVVLSSLVMRSGRQSCLRQLKVSLGRRWRRVRRQAGQMALRMTRWRQRSEQGYVGMGPINQSISSAVCAQEAQEGRQEAW